MSINTLLDSSSFTKQDIITLLQAEGEDRAALFTKSAEIKREYVGNKVYFRGLLEYSNICKKDCYYCGIRGSNHNTNRYTMTEEEVLEAVQYAHSERFASLVIQSGEVSNPEFVHKITALLLKIREITNNEMGVTLSLGEQSRETLLEWREAGARRYLLRIESSNQELYSKIHPQNKTHDYQNRLASIHLLRETGYQVGSGVMIGLPFQTVEHLADDLIFLRDLDIDMVGMGPYVEHQDTPLYQYKDTLWPQTRRFDLTLKMISILRIMMKDINIAATTALQAIDGTGREKALKVGANIMMPNLTPVKYRRNYLLYEDKPCVDEEAFECKTCLEARIHLAGDVIGYGEWGDSKHFARLKKK